eukprot:scaffold26193_cov153-Skeletonema_marinoi.AAC.6
MKAYTLPYGMNLEPSKQEAELSERYSIAILHNNRETIRETLFLTVSCNTPKEKAMWPYKPRTKGSRDNSRSQNKGTNLA